MVNLKDNSGEVLKKFERAQQRALKAIGLAAEGHAKDQTPVDTGRLRNSMANKVSENSAYIGTNVEYGPYAEFGSRTNFPHHMIEKAATQHSDEYKRLAEQSFENA